MKRMIEDDGNKYKSKEKVKEKAVETKKHRRIGSLEDAGMIF